jgi:very-short-patch-repair endonuclease
MLDYIVFFGLLALSLIAYAVHLKRYRPEAVPPTPPIDFERIKIESPIELRLYLALKERGHHVRTQYIEPPKTYRFDLALPQYKIAIECDGKAFHSTPEQIARDRKKEAYLKRKGWKVLRFSGRQINRNLPSVLKKIEETIN